MSDQTPEKRPNKNKEPFTEIMKSMNSFFQERPVRGFLESIDDFFKNSMPHHSFPVDVVETKKEYIITAELPGIKKDHIYIETFGNEIKISIQNREDVTEENDIQQTFRRRVTLRQASRSIRLPVTINEKQVKATYQDGLLQIKIPRKGGKSIQID